jgi:hypothetical protein
MIERKQVSENIPLSLGTAEELQLAIERYRDADGNPACALSFKDGKICKFYYTRTFGTRESCWFGEPNELLQRRKEGLGTLIPIEACPLWKTGQEHT